MSDYLTGYNPNRIAYDSLYTSSSLNTVPVDTVPQPTGTNYTPKVSLETPPDTFELSAESKIRGESDKDSGLSTGMKWLLGIGATAAAAYGCVVGHRALTKPSIEKVTQNFSEIFRRDVSKEEAQKMTEKYKEIFKIKDKDEFRIKMFEQVKKDFGYENLDVESYKIPEEMLKKNSHLGGGYYPLQPLFEENGKNYTMNGFSTEVVAINPNLSKKDMFYNIIHELTHMKQHELAYRLDKNKFFEAIRKARLTDFEPTDKIVQEYNKTLEKVYSPVWDKLPKITEKSKEYELATKYLKDIENYRSASSGASYSEYSTQFVEQEAHGTKPKVQDAYNYFANIWRIPFFQ